MNFNELFESAYEKDLHLEPREFVKFYDTNRIIIEGQNTSSNNVIYDRITRITSDYAHCLFCNESHTKAKPVIQKAIHLFQNHPDYKKRDLFEIKYYEVLTFDKAVVNYHEKKYTEAIQDLRILCKKFPDDERFREWFNAAKMYKYTHLERASYVIMGIALLTDLFIDDLNPKLDQTLTILGGISLLTLGVIAIIKWQIKKKSL